MAGVWRLCLLRQASLEIANQPRNEITGKFHPFGSSCSPEPTLKVCYCRFDSI